MLARTCSNNPLLGTILSITSEAPFWDAWGILLIVEPLARSQISKVFRFTDLHKNQLISPCHVARQNKFETILH